MTNILIIEDEEPAYKNLKRFILKNSFNYNIVAWLRSVEQSVDWIRNNPGPDLIFLDIQLSDGCAFDIFEQIPIEAPIIFSTAYDEFALKAFELNSVDYLLKPISFQSVQRSLNKFQSYHSFNKTDSQVIKSLLEDIAKLKNQYTNRFLVKRGGELIRLLTKDISYFYADDSTFCVANNGRIYSINHSLTKIIDLLDPDLFFRLNRKVICHVDAIDKVTKSLGSKLRIRLSNKPDFDVTVSREKMEQFKSWFGTR